MTENEDRVREFAYQIWESEGRPAGHEARHWEMATKLAAAEAGKGQTASRPKAPRKPRAAALQGVTEDGPVPVVKQPRASNKAKIKTKSD